jgi:hypothetical protein
MAAQRLTQRNAGAPLRLTEADLLLAGETPRFDGRALRVVRTRIARDGFAERSVHDIACLPAHFWHCSDLLLPDRLDQVVAAVQAAAAALVGVDVEEDPNGHYRQIECWVDGRPARLRVQYVDGAARQDVPAFEAAWSLLVRLFPPLPDPA